MEIIGTYQSQSTEQSAQIAAKLAKLFRPGDVVLLEGELGSGKTFMVKAICRILNTSDEASSPSFAIIHRYAGPVPVNHVDFYRIYDVRELDNLGWEELLDNHSVTFIEWPQIIEPLLDRYYKLQITAEGQARQFDLLKK